VLLVSAKEAAELLKKALSLPVSERADLAGSLIESLDDTQDESVAAAWDEEVARRRPTSIAAPSSRFRSKRLVAASCPLSC